MSRGIRPHKKIKKFGLNYLVRTRNFYGGGHRIRTCGGFHLNGFQDRRFKPLSQSSKHLDYTLFFSILQVVLYCFIKKMVRKKSFTRIFCEINPFITTKIL